MTISTTGPYDPAVHQTAAASWEKGRTAGLHDGYDEGYLRGRANAIVARMKAVFPFRQIHVLYVVSGKGLPYSPLDEAVITTLQSMTAQVTVTDPRQPVGDIAAQLRPNLMLALDGMDLPLEQVTAVRQLGIPTAIWLTDDPYYTDTTTKIVTNYDYVFTLEMNCMELYRQLGCTSVHYLPFGAFLTHYFPSARPLRYDVRLGLQAQPTGTASISLIRLCRSSWLVTLKSTESGGIVSQIISRMATKLSWVAGCLRARPMIRTTAAKS